MTYYFLSWRTNIENPKIMKFENLEDAEEEARKPTYDFTSWIIATYDENGNPYIISNRNTDSGSGKIIFDVTIATLIILVLIVVVTFIVLRCF